MARQRLLQISVVVLLLAATSSQASSLSISIGGRGIQVSASNRPLIHHSRPPVYAYPRILRPQPRIMVPRRPVHVYRPVYQPPVYHPTLAPCAQPGIVTVWITNSNGSRQPVVLTKTPHGYQGPRGEYYTTFPSNRQLQCAYGF
jgi:hypothetical protein